MTTTLSINIPDRLAQESQQAALRMGISRTEFIRRAIAHELREFEAQLEEEAMAQSMRAMKANKNYLRESEEIINGFSNKLPKDKKEWWKQKS